MANKKAKPVKWSIGADEPEDMQEFLSNDEIIVKNTHKKTKEVDWPARGPHTFVVRKVTVKPNRNDDDRVGVMLVLKNGKGEDQAWNGYAIFDGFNITEQGTPFLKRWLRSVGLTWKDFYSKTKAIEDGDDKQQIVQIGNVKFDGSTEVLIQATVKVKGPDNFNDDDHLEIARYIPMSDEDEEDEEDEDEDEAEDFSDEEDEDEDESDDDEDEDDEEDEDEDDEDEDDEDAEEELREELNDLSLAALKKRGVRSAKKAKVDSDDMPTKKKALVDWIVSVELNEPPF